MQERDVVGCDSLEGVNLHGICQGEKTGTTPTPTHQCQTVNRGQFVGVDLIV